MTWQLGLGLVLIAMLLSLAMPAAAEESPDFTEPVCYEHGDVNGDGTVDRRDALFVLYRCLFEGSAEYETFQDCDFNGDGKLTSDDALYVLYSVSGGEPAQSHPLKGTIHQYYPPVWTWKEDLSAQVTLKCGCGQTTLLTEAEGVAVQKGEEKAATCVDGGVVEYTASVTYDGNVFSDTKQVVTFAAGHTMEGVRDCETASKCTACGYTLEPLGHDWVLDADKSVAATCHSLAVQVYKCGNEDCAEEKSVTLEGYAEHAFVLADTEQDGCQIRQILKCECGEETEGAVYYEHQYTAELTREANCREAGVKTFVCACGDTYTEAVPANDAHSWVETGTENGITGYSCVCGETKTAVCTTGDTASVTKESLEAVSEVQIRDVAVSLDDQVIGNLGDSVQIRIETTTAAELAVDDQAKAQIGSNPVYDITMRSDDAAVSDLKGTATISVPYTLQEGDDVDCIDIWFISDDGSVTCVQGTYSNGYVTFATSHFSYYTVTRLTPAQRCETYGHAIGTSHRDATCTKEGYHSEICQRCGYVQADTVLNMIDHNYQETVTPATCLAEGSFEKVCASCQETISGAIPALGHSWHKDESQSAEATCAAAGKTVYVCSRNDCGASYTEEIPQLKHDYGDSEETEADCESQGHKKRVCKLCGMEEVIDQTAPTGHRYLEENVVWTWTEDHTGATATLVCSYNKNHTKTLKAVVSSELTGNACQGTGSATYTATASFNTFTYTDTKTVDLEQTAHQPAETWHSDAAGHSRSCAVCGETLDAGSHVWGQQTVVEEATCSEDGLATQNCTVCAYTREVVLEATRDHDYVNGVCKDCGFVENSCNHIRTHKTPLDLSGYDVCSGADIRIVSCDCGELAYLNIWSLMCDMEYSERQELQPNGETHTISIESCRICGLTLEGRWYQELDKETCHTTEVQETRLLVKGVQIASSRRTWTEGEGSGEHIANIVGETVDLSEYGDLCGEILVNYHCYCGEKSRIGVEESICRWTYDDALSTEDVDVYRCRTCGAVRKEFRGGDSEKENCTVTSSYKTVYEVGGQEIYSYTNQEIWTEHTYRVTETELDGDSCLDGVYLKQVCQDCGEIYEWYSYYHADAERTETKIEGFCSDLVVQTVCACGESKSCYVTSSGNSHCRWDYIDSSTRRCETCGLTETKETTTGEKSEDCQVTETTRCVYTDKTGKTVASGVRIETMESHRWDTDYTLQGQSCEDGVKIEKTCFDCGKHQQYTTYKHEQKETVYELAEYGLCGDELVVYRCPCGEDSGYHDTAEECNWEYLKGEDGKRVHFCPECGVTRTVVETEAVPAGTCRMACQVTITYTKGETTLLKVETTKTYANHRYVHTLTPFGSSCEDGYQITEKCLTCGYTSEWENYDDDCGTWPVARKWLSQGTLCGDLELVSYSCACGYLTEEQAEWYGGECDHDEIWLGEEKGYVSTCSQCGAERSRIVVEDGKSSDSCLYQRVENVTYSKNGSKLFAYTSRDVWESHDYVSSFQLFGETCEDGFKVTEKCFDCGKTNTYTRSNADCTYWFTTAMEVLHDGEGLCGPVIKRTDGCACGNDRSISVNDDCTWEYITSGHEGSTYLCRECGAQRTVFSESTEDRDACTITRHYVYTYEKDGAVLLETEFRYTEMYHKYVAEYELLGDSCEDGYYKTRHCARCGYRDSYRGFGTDHNTSCTEYYDLRKFGLCDGEIWINSCACGQQTSVSYSWNACSWQYTGNDDSATGLSRYYCAKCRTYRIIGSVGAMEKNSCDWKGTFYAILTRDGETLLNLKQPEVRKEHRYILEDVVLHDPAQGCEGGYRGTMKCQFCTYSYTTSGSDHSTHAAEQLYLQDLYEDVCGDGYITLYTCACGEYSSWDWYKEGCSNQWSSDTYEGADGYTHNVDTRVCSECGITLTEDYYLQKTPGNCLQYRNSTVTLSLNGQILKTWTVRQRQYSHTTDRTYSLLPGSDSCEDGLYATDICRFCDYKNTWHYSSGSDYNHSYYNPDAANTIDLTDYGSVCGGELIRYVCACGKQQRYDFSEDSLCDIDRVGISHWIPGTIDSAQYTTEGYVWTDSVSYRLTCAVTDPDCGLKIRMSEYWLDVNCAATQYQTWQLGYDDLTDTCQYEFTIQTGKTHGYHPYQTSNSSSQQEDGTTVETNAQNCTRCASSYIVTRTYKDGGKVKETQVATNTLNNGENKQYVRVYEYGQEYAGYRYETMESYDVTYADGTAYWEKYVYTYDFDKGCLRTTTYTNSDGLKNVTEAAAHVRNISRITIKDPTCTQYGEYWEVYTCEVCAEEYARYRYQWSPTAHNWSWNSSEQFYECTDCGLENINGASGEIVMEDMTQSHGEGVNYVVGYWNRGGVDALRYVSVVLKDAAEGDNDEIVLTDIAFTYLTQKQDGITAVSFSKAAVQAAAEKAVADAGYTGSYAIRFTFVPKYSTDTLDYAITFDTLDT